jgi:hypothetical protein
VSDFAIEAGHWYDRDGSPRYTIVSNGKERPTTLRDARKLGYVPSVTTIMRSAAAPGLERWKAEQLLMAALTLPRRPHEPETEWLRRVREDSVTQAKAAADRGSAIHGAIEQHFRGGTPPEPLMPWVDVVVGEIRKRCGERRWLPERSFASPLGYGGKPDLYSPEWIVDIKTKDGVEDAKLWDEHPMQLAAYRRALCRGARAGILFVDRVDPVCRFIEVPEDDMKRGLVMFDHLFGYWKAKNNYDPAMQRETA